MRLRRELGLRCKQKRRFKATTNSKHACPVAPNLSEQTFAPTEPNEAWVSDITYVATDEGWLYLAGIKDVFTCEMPGLILHSDRGSQYCADDYRKLVDQFGMTASMSRKGNCCDNAPMESFWGSLKNELIHHQRYATRADAESAITEYIEILQPPAAPFASRVPIASIVCRRIQQKEAGCLKRTCPLLAVHLRS